MRLLRFWQGKKKSPVRQAVDLAFKYGTHVPVLKAMLEVFQPKGILELGAGTVSTPLFYQYGKKLISVETNERWVQELKGALPDRDGFTLIHHALPGLTERTKVGAITQQVKTDCVNFYMSIRENNRDLELLLIDHVSGLRAFTLASLYAKFDFVVYHDAEDKGYGWDLLRRYDTGSHLHFVLETLVPHTGFLIRTCFAPQLPQFKRALDRHTKEYFSLKYHFDLKDLAKAG